ncbi:MAG: DUF4173 domain-containing protein [Actinomycetota bacterium]
MTQETLVRPADVTPRAGSRYAAAVLAASILAAVLIPGPAPGLNLPLLALAAGGAVYQARPREISATVWLYAGLGFLLSLTAVVRAAEWVVAVNALAPLLLAGLAATEARTAADMAWTPFALLGRLPRAAGFLASSMAPSRGRARPVLRGTLLAAALVTVFGLLFGSADRAFADLISRVLPGWDLGSIPLRIVVFVVAAIAIGTLGLARATAPHPAPDGLPVFGTRPGEPPLSRTEWTIALGALDALFAVFVGVQVAVLFGGHEHVFQTPGLTYAEYARQGFFQLLAVAVLVLAVLGAVVRFGAVDVRRMRLLAGALCALTFVVLGSAVHRLGLYEETFGFTQERLVVHAVTWWLGALFVLVLAAGAVWRGAWLPRAVVVLTAAGLLAFTLANPDALVASRNVERFSRTGSLDLDYLGAGMSADAVPALQRLPQPYRDCVLWPVAARLGNDDGWTGFNLARSRARMLLEGLKRPTAPCPVEVP